MMSKPPRRKRGRRGLQPQAIKAANETGLTIALSGDFAFDQLRFTAIFVLSCKASQEELESCANAPFSDADDIVPGAKEAAFECRF
jgi:hypothetical protein